MSDAAVVFGAVGIAVAIGAFIAATLNVRQVGRQVSVAAMLTTVEWLEQSRPKRRVLYSIDRDKAFSRWTSKEKEAAYEMTRWFDVLGILVRLKYIPADFALAFYAIPAMAVWEICEPFIQHERSERGPHHLWEFEQLKGRWPSALEEHPAYQEGT